jgi:molybdenum cofactor cytidylyltransferase
MASARIAAVLLAAGRGSRFGGNKLEAMLGGSMLGIHAARALVSVNPEWLMAVCNPAHVGLTAALGAMPFEIFENAAPEAGQSRSLIIAVQAAQRVGADALLVALADMPLVTPTHLAALVSAFEQHDREQCVSTASGPQRMPPAIFPRAMFADLARMTGDAGARSLLKSAVMVPADPAILVDIDTLDDLRTLRRR